MSEADSVLGRNSLTWRIHTVSVTASTNDDARQAAEAGEAEGFVVHALRQTAGRGRYGRTWESSEGNLYCSVLLRPSGTPHIFGQYSFVAALALCDTVREFLPHAAVTLKWPNDVLVNGKKIGGILLESGPGWLIIGMGLNVRHYPEDALYPATSLYTHTTSFRNDVEGDLSVVLSTLLNHLWRWHETMAKNGFAPVRSAWLEKAQKGRMIVRLPDRTIEGDFIDIDAAGHLRLRLADGAERAIATGDVFLA